MLQVGSSFVNESMLTIPKVEAKRASWQERKCHTSSLSPLSDSFIWGELPGQTSSVGAVRCPELGRHSCPLP